MELLENTYFINLDERPDRLEHVLSEFKKLGITGTRYKGNKTKNGAVGCTLSHIKCLELAKQNNYPHIFICEDDITFLEPDVFLKNLKKFKNSVYYENWDVIIVGGNNAPPFQPINNYCIQVYNSQTTTGYIVNNRYYDTLINNFKTGIKNLISNPDNKREYAIDMYWKQLQRQDKWYMIIPPTVIQYESYSDIEERVVNYKNLMLDLEKPWVTNQATPSFHNMLYRLPRG